MADFRKWILALSVLALVFTGVASAQVTGTSSPIVCATTAQPLTLRTEGYTELVGDILLQCTGGVIGPINSAIQPTNVTVTLPSTVTSRTIGSSSEALLLLDEPGSVQFGGFGPAQAQTLCSTPLSGCPAYVGEVLFQAAELLVPVYYNTAELAPNVYSGVTSGQQVTFFGVPIMAPMTVGNSRYIRITNIRINANQLTGGGSTYTDVLADISVNNSQITVNNPNPTVGFIQQSMVPSFRNGQPVGGNGPNTTTVQTTTLYQCQSETNYPVAYLRYSEQFGTAFKTRVSASGTFYNTPEGSYPFTVNANAIQNIPGGVGTEYGYSESNFISDFVTTTDYPFLVSGNLTSSKGYFAGLADYGTRLKAVFNNLPSGVSVYVTQTNVTDGGGNLEFFATEGTPQGSGIFPAGGIYFDNGAPSLTNNPSSELAALVGAAATSEATVDNTESIPEVSATNSGSGTCTSAACLPALYQLSPNSSGSAEVIWEVIQALSNASENFDFGVYVAYPAGLSPLSGITATLSYAPTPTVPFSGSAGGAASNSLTIPRFAITSATSPNFFAISSCNTALLFPYVTTAFLVAGQSGFDTGISIANTSTDPFGTAAQTGLCSLNWYGGTPGSTTASTATSATQTTLGAGGVGSTVPIISGTTALTLASQNVPADWSGYMIALCNFQYAHGYATVTDVGARNIMASYLALILASSGNIYRGNNGYSSAEQLEN